MTVGFTGSLLEMVNTAESPPEGDSGWNSTWNGKQKSELITTGNPEEGVSTEKSGSSEVMEAISRFSSPVLHTSNVATPESPGQASPTSTLLGAWIWGTQQTIFEAKKESMFVEAGMEAGAVPEAQVM